MSADTVPVAKPRIVAIEWKYKPALGFYSQMDNVGLSVVDSFPEWRREPLKLELVNNTQHSRVWLSYERSFAEFYTPSDIDSAIAKTVNIHGKFQEHLAVEEFKRLGLRFVYALTFQQTFERMVERLQSRLVKESDRFSQVLGKKVLDVAYVFNLELDSGWKCNLQIGPMTQKEWFQKVGHQPQMFQSPTEGKHTLDRYRKSIPSTLLYADFDYFQENVPSNEFDSVTADAGRRVIQTVKHFIEFYNKG